MKFRKILLLAGITALLFAGINFAQDNKDDVINKAVVKLQQKVLLTEDQSAQVKSLLASNYASIVAGKPDAADQQINALLNEKQKNKFTIIKKDWFNQIKTGTIH